MFSYTYIKHQDRQIVFVLKQKNKKKRKGRKLYNWPKRVMIIDNNPASWQSHALGPLTTNRGRKLWSFQLRQQHLYM